MPEIDRAATGDRGQRRGEVEGRDLGRLGLDLAGLLRERASGEQVELEVVLSIPYLDAAATEADVEVRHGDVVGIIERGDHDDLLEQKGRYYQLYTGQYELT